MWNDHENVDGKFGLFSESSSCGLLLKSLEWRDRCHNESEATMDDESSARLGSNSQHERAKWQRCHQRRGWRDDCRAVTLCERREGRGDDPACDHGDEEGHRGEAAWKSTIVEDQDDEKMRRHAWTGLLVRRPTCETVQGHRRGEPCGPWQDGPDRAGGSCDVAVAEPVGRVKAGRQLHIETSKS